MRALVVDDIQDNLDLMKILLQSEGHDVFTALNGAEAFEALQAGEFDLVISDILMPVMDGFQLCKKIRSNEKLLNIPFVFYTATYIGKQDEELAMKLGANGFIIKPCDPDEFLEKLCNILERINRAETKKCPVVVIPDGEIFQLYNERLVQKLESKMLALEKSEHRYRQLVTSIQDLVVTLDVNLVIETINHRCNKYGLTGESCLGQWLGEILNETGGQTLRFWQTANMEERRGLTPLLVGLKNIVSHGEAYLELSLFEIKEEGILLGYLGVGRDVTKRLQLEAQLMQAHKLEAVGRLASGVAHDFNNILTVIMGHTELLFDELEDQPHYRDQMGFLNSTAGKAADLTRKLLAFCRQQPMKLQNLSLPETISEAKWIVTKLLGEDVALTMDLSESVPPVRVDPTLITQVIINLVSNAHDAMPNGGELKISVRNAKQETVCKDSECGQGDNGFVLLEVSDTGDGIPPEVLPKIFDPFFTTKPVGQSTGMGLSTVYGITKQSGGHIEVDSQPNQGTTFKVYLPACPCATLDVIEIDASPEEEVCGQETVLLVDDEPAIREVVGRMLTALGFKVLVANSGEHALQQLSQANGQVDLLLTDYLLKGETGNDVAKKVLKVKPDLPVVIMSGNTAAEGYDKNEPQKPCHWLAKPFDSGEFLKIIRAALGYSRKNVAGP